MHAAAWRAHARSQRQRFASAVLGNERGERPHAIGVAAMVAVQIDHEHAFATGDRQPCSVSGFREQAFNRARIKRCPLAPTFERRTLLRREHRNRP